VEFLKSQITTRFTIHDSERVDFLRNCVVKGKPTNKDIVCVTSRLVPVAAQDVVDTQVLQWVLQWVLQFVLQCVFQCVAVCDVKTGACFCS